jgi:ketosteroid isomerase-like protein
MDDVERLVASEAIRQLAARYALATDSRDLDALVALFVDDVQVGRDRSGRAALREAFDASLRGVGITILNVGTHVIDLVDADHASGAVYCKGEVQDGERWIHQAILYRDTYERRDGRWLFVRRRHDLWYGAEAGTNPLDLPPADWPARADGRGTAPALFPTWEAFWSGS